ncbi:hypothetical protein WJX79_005078 [Trebouxia sp. C0005]
MLNTAASLPSGPQRAAVDDAFMSSSGTTDEKRHKSRFSHLFKLPSVLSKGKHGHSSLNPNAPSEKELADKAYWCRDFAQINAVALRKLLEHHDAMLGSTTGCGTQKCMGAAFLHSPLLAELQALESRVREDTAAATQSALVQESVRAFDPASALIDQLRTSADPKNDSDFDRQIAYQIQVQNTIKKGVVQHWLDKAQVNDKSTDFGGLKNELEASEAMMRIGPVSCVWDPERVLAAIDSNAKCPECEQAGMFKGAVYLEQVHQLVKQRFPVQWLGRQADNRYRTQYLKDWNRLQL